MITTSTSGSSITRLALDVARSKPARSASVLADRPDAEATITNCSNPAFLHAGTSVARAKLPAPSKPIPPVPLTRRRLTVMDRGVSSGDL